MSIHMKVVAWFATGETGLSSEHMAAVACGVAGGGSTPADPSDLNRCIKLVCAVPEVREHFAAIANSGPRWRAVIDHWDELVALFHSEVGENWSLGHRAPKTYERMKALGL